MIPRVYLQFSKSQNEIIIEDDDVHYLSNVLRKKNGDDVRIFNELQGEYRAVIQQVKKNKMTLMLEEKLKDPRKSDPLILIFSILKNDTMSWVFEKATELGVTDFYPIHSEYSQKQVFKEDKWYKVIKNAVQQCERFDMPQIHTVSTLTPILQLHKNCDLYAALERQTQEEKLQKVQSIRSSDAVKGLIVGPEGGWSRAEREILIQSNAHLFCLGQNVLRAETAIIAALSVMTIKL